MSLSLQMGHTDHVFDVYVIGLKTVQALLDQHFSGEADWEHLVAALSVFEIAHRLWVGS